MDNEFKKRILDEYKNNRSGFWSKCIYRTKRLIRFFNVPNRNLRDLAEREVVYKKFKRKYAKFLVKDNDYNKIEFSNYIWICWFQGYENAPDLVKACIQSIKRFYPKKKIVIIDDKNMFDYIDMPEYIIQKWKKGIIPYAQFSDILRLELLTKYGGFWIDSTVFMTDSAQNYYFTDDMPLFVFKNLSLNRSQKLATSASNWLIYSCKDNHILELTKKLLYVYWKKHNKLSNYFIFHIFFTMATEVYADEWDKVPTFSNISPHILQFELLDKYSDERFEQIKNISRFHKLNRKIISDDENSFYCHLIKEYSDKF